MKKWHVYIVECSDGTLYTGCTNDLLQRMHVHNLGKGAKYTRSRTPVALVCSEITTSRSQAQIRESELKKLSKKQKIALISSVADS